MLVAKGKGSETRLACGHAPRRCAARGGFATGKARRTKARWHLGTSKCGSAAGSARRTSYIGTRITDDAPAVLALLASRAIGRRLARHAACHRSARTHAGCAYIVLGACVVIVTGRVVGPILNDAEALRTTDRTMALVDRHACAIGVDLALHT